jgi:hypothetical protein
VGRRVYETWQTCIHDMTSIVAMSYKPPATSYSAHLFHQSSTPHPWTCASYTTLDRYNKMYAVESSPPPSRDMILLTGTTETLSSASPKSRSR